MVFNVVLLVILIDILSKYLVVQLIPYSSSLCVIPGIVDFTYIKNDGAAFGMLSGHRWIFMTASVVFIFLIAFVLKKSYTHNKLYMVSLSMILGGGIANMIDRIFLGYVVDFIEITFVDFAVFNLADSCITVGIVLFAVYLLFYDDTFFPSKARKENKDENINE